MNVMRTPMNTISPLILYWSIIYVLALLSIYTYVAGILGGNRNSTRTPAKNLIRSNRGLRIPNNQQSST